MRRIAHISDLHFGTEDPLIGAALCVQLNAIRPDLIVVSGDLTQRARRSEFRAARDFLQSLPQPQLVVPGNHDIPLFDVVRRFMAPTERFQEFISHDLDPVYRDAEMLVIGINTARSMTWKNGRISVDQMATLEKTMCSVREPIFKIAVTHHPFLPTPGETEGAAELVGRAERAVVILDRCETDLLLAGHLHHGFTEDVRTYYPATRRSIIVVQAGTAISRRVRNEPNAYNLITLDHQKIDIAVNVWDGKDFTDSRRVAYRIFDEEWRAVEVSGEST